MSGKATTVAQYIAGVMLVLATLKGPGAAQEAQQCIEHTIEYQFNEEDPRLIFTCTIRCNGRLFVTVVYADNPNIEVDFTEHNIVSQDVATSPSTLEVPLQQNNTGLLVCCCGDDIQPLSTNLEEKVTRCDNRTINQFEGDGSVLSNRSNVALVESTFLNVTCWRAPGYYFGGCLVVVFGEDATVLETVYTNAFENETVQKMITVVTVQNINGVALHGVNIFKRPSEEANFAYSFQPNGTTEPTMRTCTTLITTSSECTAECNNALTIGFAIATGVLIVMLIIMGSICGYMCYHCKKTQSETLPTGQQTKLQQTGSDDTADLQSQKAKNNTSKDGLAPHKTSSKRRDLNIEKPPATTATNAKNEGDIKRLSEKDNRPSTGIDNTKKKSSLKRKGSTRSLGGSRRVSPAPPDLHMHKMQGARNKDDGMECGQNKQSRITLADIEIHESDVEVSNGQGVFLEHNRDTVPNFGLLLHNMVGRISNDADEDGNLVCRTDNTSCCRDFDSPNGIGFGHWYYPSGDLVVSISQPRATGQIYEMLRADQDVRLRRDNSAFIRATANGIYRCEVPDQNGVNRNRYVGLYSIGAGAVFISQNPQFSLISNDPLEFTLTSTTTGGPLTTANWSRPDNGMVTGDQVLVDGVAATVRHTLSVTGRFPEVYMFSTINVRTNALDTRSITIQAANPPTNLTAAQSGIISVQVSWTAPASGGALRTGYRIFYQTGGSEQSVDAAAGVASRTLTGLLSGMTYNISIESRSNSLPSAVLGPSVVRIRAFEDLAVTTVPSPTSIRVAFAQPSGSLAAESYMTYSTPVSLERVRHCVTVCRILGLPLTCSPFTITDLQEFSSYNIAITVHGLNATHVTNKQTVTFPAAPIAAPQDLSVTVLSTSITFGWDPVACIERNGVIDNYIVRFGPEGGVQSERTVQSGGIDVAGTHTASGLNPFTNYSFEVAAVNSAGTGPFTATLTVVTIGGGGLSSVSIEAIIAAAVVVVLVVLVLTGVFITVLLVLKHRRGAPPHTHEPPTEAAVLSTPSGSAQPISTEPCVAYQTVTSAQQQQQSSTPTPTYPLGQQSCDQPEMPHVCV